ncbi:MAG: hypothetical protein IJS58_03140 [Bacilli bacterium]|nr:hypothetical protein [Bacilli bacterium]
MKKRICIIILLFLSLFLVSCAKKINNTHFSKETLESFSLGEDFPKIEKEPTSLMSETNYFVFLTEEEYEEYSMEVYEYLYLNYYYVGTYYANGLVAEMFPRYEYKKLNKVYDFKASNHEFIYSTNNTEYEGGELITPCYMINIERVEETKFNLFSKSKYNTIIRLTTQYVYYPYE